MLIKSLITWLKEQRLKHLDDEVCGVWPFATGKWDIFLPFCIEHDRIYRESEEMYARGVHLNDNELKDTALEMKRQGDARLYLACLEKAQSYSWPLRTITVPWAEAYVDIVTEVGDYIWFSSVGQLVLKYESKDSPYIQMRLLAKIQDAPEGS